MDKRSKADYAIINDLHKLVPVLCEAIRDEACQLAVQLGAVPWTAWRYGARRQGRHRLLAVRCMA
jgi:hypothetical protein